MVTFVTLYVVFSTVAGVLARGYIAAYLTSCESIDHPHPALRLVWRYLLFSASYGFSVLVSPMLITPALRALGSHLPSGGVPLVIETIPLAVLLHFASCGLIRAGDERKLRARELFRKR